ncbi:hypothetical protein AVEN_256538-1 [Araneus ventricosus]|uniref:Uncharacterized protein n=1 Tax=Araneus ventricosus TaxID=182803 RepID=A0A4Y2R5L0_ARAVE|nr:hypothetical protein AVEN_197088-1 [Araneus ventricosus]GBO35560.1 hypothetical protein AVEN_256538-1 [Araneus ventricosus]
MGAFQHNEKDPSSLCGLIKPVQTSEKRFCSPLVTKYKQVCYPLNTKDLPRPGQAHVVTKSATISAVDELIRQNCRITKREITFELPISKRTVHHLIHKKLGYGKVCAH